MRILYFLRERGTASFVGGAAQERVRVVSSLIRRDAVGTPNAAYLRPDIGTPFPCRVTTEEMPRLPSRGTADRLTGIVSAELQTGGRKRRETQRNNPTDNTGIGRAKKGTSARNTGIGHPKQRTSGSNAEIRRAKEGTSAPNTRIGRAKQGTFAPWAHTASSAAEIPFPSLAPASLLCIFLFVAATCRVATALDVQFRVVSPDGAPSVSVNGNPPQLMTQFTTGGPLNASVSGAPYYTTVVQGLTPPVKYQYTVNGVPEGFDREFNGDGGRSATYNDFFNRKDTVVKLPNLRLAFGKRWSRGWGATPAFDDQYIPTLYFQGDQAIIDSMLTASTNVSANLTLLAVFKEEAFVLPLTEWKPTGLNKKVQFAKRDFKVKLQQRVTIYGRDEWKLKSMSLDPVAIREKAFTDISEAAGVPVARANYVRVYANASPIGLYLMADDPTTNSYLRAEFHGDVRFKEYTVLGSLVKAESPFRFTYNGPERADYPEVSVHYLGNNPPTNPLLTLISRWIEPLMMLNSGDNSAVGKTIAPAVDIDVLVKSAALEWLAGCWRGAWGAADEFAVYEDPITNKWFYITNDPAESFGIGVTPPNFPGNFVAQSFRLYSYRRPRPVIQKLLAAPEYGNFMAWTISELVRTAFNPGTLGARVRALAARIRPEVEWDRSLARLSPGQADLYKIADFDSGLNATVARVFSAAGAQEGTEPMGTTATTSATSAIADREPPQAASTTTNAVGAEPTDGTDAATPLFLNPKPLRSVLKPVEPSAPQIPGIALGILSWVEQRTSSVAAELKVSPDQSLTGPDPDITPPTTEQLKGRQSLLAPASRHKAMAWPLLLVSTSAVAIAFGL